MKRINKKSTWIMDCPKPELVKTCSEFLTIIDDAQQESPDEQTSTELEYFYNQLEWQYRKIKTQRIISDNTRNSIRLICKYAIKTIPSKS